MLKHLTALQLSNTSKSIWGRDVTYSITMVTVQMTMPPGYDQKWQKSLLQLFSYSTWNFKHITRQYYGSTYKIRLHYRAC